MNIKFFIGEKKCFLEYHDKEVFRDSIDSPFIIVGRGKLKITNRRGTFKVKERISSEEALRFSGASDTALGKELLFSRSDISIYILLIEENGTLKMMLRSEGVFDYVTFNFSAYPQERIFGLGEQFLRLDHKGFEIENMVSEHISLMPIIRKTIPPFNLFKLRPKSKVKTYAPMSIYMSSNRYALKVDTNAYGIENFTKNKSILRYWELPKEIIYAQGASYKELSNKLNDSRQYLPDWTRQGMILGIQGGIDYAISQAFKMLDSGAKISGVWCQDWSGRKITVAGKQVYWNWEVDEENYGDLSGKINTLNSRGVKFLGYINPYLIKDGSMYNYCKAKGYLITEKNNEVYHFMTTTFPAAMMDLTNPGMVSMIKDTIIKKNMIDLGISGWMADFGEYLPAGLRLYSGDPSEKMHNVWPTMWSKINREAIEEAGAIDKVFFFTRSAYNGSGSYTPIMWTGDQHTDYSVDYGMPCTVPAIINLGLSGVTLAHSDIGGYITFKSLKRDNELFIRWMSMNTFSPVMRTHETTRPMENAQYDTEGVLEYSVYFSTIHCMLTPYIDKVIKQTGDGIPAIRAVFYNYNDIALYNDIYTYMLGDDLLIAPVMEKGKNTQEISLPLGSWVHLFSGENYSGGDITLDAPLYSPPVFYRKDSVYRDTFSAVTAYAKAYISVFQ